MTRRDISHYLAKQTAEHLKSKVGSSTFAGGVFGVEGNQLTAHGGYRLSFVDGDSLIRIVVDRNYEELSDFEGFLKSLNVPRKYAGVLESVSVSSGADDGVYVDLHMKIRATSGKRVSNEERIFHAVFHTAVRRILEVAYDSR